MQVVSYDVMLRGFTIIADLFSKVELKDYAVFRNVDESLPLSEVMQDKRISYMQCNKAVDLVESRLGVVNGSENYTLLHVGDRFMQLFWVDVVSKVLMRGGFVCNYDCETQILTCYKNTYKGWVKAPFTDVRDLFDFIMNEVGKHLYTIVLEGNEMLHDDATHKIEHLDVT